MYLKDVSQVKILPLSIPLMAITEGATDDSALKVQLKEKLE